MLAELEYPFDADTIMRRKKSLKKRLITETSDFIEKKIAILGGSTTSEVRDCLELFLLNMGIKAVFYESEYNQYYEESMFENIALKEFNPDFIYLHMTMDNILQLPCISDSKDEIYTKIDTEFLRLKNIWENLTRTYQSIVIQNNFAFPMGRMLGNMDSVDMHGITFFISQLNQKIITYIQEVLFLKLNDVQYLSARMGLDQWYDKNFWYSYKIALSYKAIPELSYNLSLIVKACLGKSKKCLVLDLDNTLWGGVIGDDGINGIQLGKETALGEAYIDFQKYVRDLKNRGVILAVCSKNDFENAKQGLTHPDSVLKYEDFIVFKANWQDKHLNLIEIASELQIGLNSIVFIDDNPVERQLVKMNLPEVEVPEIDANDISTYITSIDRAGYFEPDKISQDDLKRNSTYHTNKMIHELKNTFAAYDEFLKSLEMEAEIRAFAPVYYERIAQLTNKTNQFNLTTRRYTIADIERFEQDDQYITLYGRLKDKFSDYGIVSIIIGKKQDEVLHIDLWLMSCRVLKRGFENTMFEALVQQVQNEGIKKIKGNYIKTKKNGIVADLYRNLGFELIEQQEEDTIWLLDLGKHKVVSVNQLMRML